jgi:hypothetical protein
MRQLLGAEYDSFNLSRAKEQAEIYDLGMSKFRQTSFYLTRALVLGFCPTLIENEVIQCRSSITGKYGLGGS